MFIILPSLASGRLTALADEAASVKDAGYLHLDIEDGNFSPGITFGPDTTRELADHTDAEMDAHLMVNEPERYIEELSDSGVRSVAFHIESTPYPSRCLNEIHRFSMRAGLALNYKTPVTAVLPYLDLAEYVLLLTNESDLRGIRFKPYSLVRIEQLRQLLPSHVELWVDGGINEELLPAVAARGADRAVVGRAIFRAEDPMKKIAELLRSAESARSGYAE